MTTERSLMPAIPPEDYEGSVGKWMMALQTRGHWDGGCWYGDVMIPEAEWWSILEECEGTPRGDT